MVKTRRLGYTGLSLSTIGLGTAGIGGSGWTWSWGPQDDEQSIAVIRRGVELGINWIDTAPVYGFGHSEEVVGRAIKGIRERVILVTKCGRKWDSKGKISGILTKDSIRREIEASFRRLKVEVIDLYLMHWPDPDKDIEEGWAAMAELVKEGKVRYIGVSNFNVEQLQRIQPIHPVASLEPPYSMLERGVEEGLLDYCAANNIGVIVYSPLQKGILTGKFTKEWIHSLPHDDHRRDRDPHFQEPELGANLALVEGLRSIAKKNDITVAHVAIGWVLRRPEVTAAIVGARRQSQIEENVVAAKWTLSNEDIEAIESLLNKRREMLKGE